MADRRAEVVQALVAAAAPGSAERFALADALCDTLADAGRPDEATAALRAAVDESAAALPADARDVFAHLVNRLADVNRHADAEALVKKLAPAADPNVAAADVLENLYVRAYRDNQPVSLGAADKLYAILEARFRAAARAARPAVRPAVVRRLYDLYGQTRSKQEARAAADMTAAGADPAVLFTLAADPDLARVWAEVLADVSDPARGVELLVTLFERVPPGVQARTYWQWQSAGDLLARQHAAAARTEPAALTARLRVVVLERLRWDLRTRNNGRAGTSKRPPHFWAAEEPAFAKVADEEFAAARHRPELRRSVTDYLADDLHRYGQAADLMLAVWKDNKLDPAGELALADYLVRDNRHAEIVDVLTPRVARDPADTQGRFRLDRALHALSKEDAVTASLKEAEKLVRAPGPAAAAQLDALAEHCADLGRAEDAARLSEDALAKWDRDGVSRGESVARAYRRRSDALAKLGRTPEAVDAAAAAVVVWGGNFDRRREAVANLDAVVAAAKDLDAVAAALDKQAERDRLENPAVRLALARAYLARKRFADAAKQADLAAGAAPDADALTLLVQALDGAGRRADATARLRAGALAGGQAASARFADLAARYAADGSAAEAERANTTLVELKPDDAAGHRLLAAVRDKQPGRPAEARFHWQRAADLHATDPAGLLGLAASYLATGDKANAAEVLKKLKARDWGASDTVPDPAARVRELEARLQK